MQINGEIKSSFRDPSGFLFLKDGLIYRQINTCYKENYDHFIKSGLYKELVDSELLIPHREVDTVHAKTDEVYKVIIPEPIPFISYPYEWCFSQLKDAALTTLKIQKKSLEFGMSLKDCSAYNIQFNRGKPVFIDTLSFEKYQEAEPWVAYRQFCQHFLAPLTLMSYRDIRLNRLLRIHIDGIPLDLASLLVPLQTHLKFTLLVHIHLHAKSQKYFADKTIKRGMHKFSKRSLLGLIDSLETAVNKLKWRIEASEWANYYTDTNYTQEAINHKIQLVTEFLDQIKPKAIWDLGANIGLFSRIASNKGIYTISFDIDPVCVERNYLQSVEKRETNILPLLLDLTNPSPGIGWENQERMSLLERAPTDTVFALALIHHLAISNNLPLYKMAEFFHMICNSLIIEFVPKSDTQVQRLLENREDIFTNYNQKIFENEFSKYFSILEFKKIINSERSLYLMRKK